MIGAILTQNTAWRNVEMAISNLRQAKCLDAQSILDMEIEELALMLKPSGYFNVKAQRLTNFCQWYVNNGEHEKLKYWDTQKLRKELLSVNGVGEETADDILLYAFDRPVFVIDAYTKRLFSRLGLVDADIKYAGLQKIFHQHFDRLDESIPASDSISALTSSSNTAKTQVVALYNEYHALIVLHVKEICKTRPKCEICCLRQCCPGNQSFEVSMD
jgi:endonuclease-3 related protein